MKYFRKSGKKNKHKEAYAEVAFLSPVTHKRNDSQECQCCMLKEVYGIVEAYRYLFSADTRNR